jgi:hypothetical protein
MGILPFCSCPFLPSGDHAFREWQFVSYPAKTDLKIHSFSSCPCPGIDRGFASGVVDVLFMPVFLFDWGGIDLCHLYLGPVCLHGRGCVLDMGDEFGRSTFRIVFLQE